MFSRIIFSVFVCFLLVSCSFEEKDLQIPKDVLPKEAMIQVLIRTHLLEAVMNTKLRSDTTSAEYKYYEKQVLKEQKIELKDFVQSKAFYYQRPKLMFEIYEAVVDSLNIRERKKIIR